MRPNEIIKAKQEWRIKMREARDAMADAERLEAARALADNVGQAPFDALKPGACVASYNAIQKELDPGKLGEALRAKGHHLALPRIQGESKKLVFRRFEANEALVEGPFGTSQPSQNAPNVNLDIVIVPLVAMDKKGGRLGYGGGYYDRTFADDTRPILVGAGYDFQLVDQLPTQPHDITLDYVMTPSALIKT